MNSCLLIDRGQTPRVNLAPDAINYGANAIRSAISTVVLLGVLVVVFFLATV